MFFALLSALSCSHAPPKAGEQDPNLLLGQICQIGNRNSVIQGSLWVQVDSTEASGQYPIQARVERTFSKRIQTQKLTVEVLNPVGGVEGTLLIKNNQYEIRGKDPQKGTLGKGSQSWSGIPLRWAHDLFLGRIPCPRESSLALSRQAVITPEGALLARTEHESFLYRFKNWEGGFWPEKLTWESDAPKEEPLKVEFEFDSPEEGSASPLRFSVVSPQGKLKARWRDREIVQTLP